MTIKLACLIPITLQRSGQTLLECSSLPRYCQDVEPWQCLPYIQSFIRLVAEGRAVAGFPSSPSFHYNACIFSSCGLREKMPFDVDRVGDALEEGRTLAPEAVGSQVLIMSGISIVTILLFNFLRPKNKIIYEPKVKYHVGNKAPPRISDSLCGWLPPLLHTKEPELVDKIGLDAVAFLRFLRLMRWFFTGVAVLTCGVLIPINVMYNLDFVNPRRRDILSMMTIRDVKGRRLYAHVAISYIITFFLMALVYFHWKKMVELRAAWFRSPEYVQSFYARTLQVTHVPKKLQSDEGIRHILQGTNMPYPATAVHIGRKVGKLPELIEYHNKTVRELENVLVRYLKGGRVARKRPTVRIGGCCGLGGRKIDAIDYYTTKLKRSEAAVEQFRNQIDRRKAENYGFVSLAAVPYAHIAAKLLSGKSPKGTTIALAPNPKDIIWANMTKSDMVIARKRLIGYWWLVIFCILNLIPLLLVAILANIDAFRSTGYFGFLDSWSNSSPVSFAIVSGFLPPAVAGIFTYFLPKVMRWLTQYMGALTHARLDRAVVARYFAFLVISQLIIFTLIGVVFNSVAEIIRQIGKGNSVGTVLKSLDKLPGNIHRTYINQASFWLKWFPMRGFLVVFDLAQIINLLWISFKTRIFGRTPRDIREWTQPSDFEYAIS
ncbi:CSC1 family protein [Pleurotus pulmonarius]